MELENLFLRFEKEFEIDLPEQADETIVSVKDACDFIRKEYARQGIEIPSGVVFDRIRRLMGIVLRADDAAIKLNTRFADVVARYNSAA
jgi:hypothetical protein